MSSIRASSVAMWALMLAMSFRIARTSRRGGTGPISGGLFDSEGKADDPAMPNDNALINLLVLVGIMVVIGLVVWKTFR